MSDISRKAGTDSLHSVGAHIDWSESFYFNFYDRGSDIAGFMRIGQKPNRGQKSMLCYLLMPDGTSMGMRMAEPMESPELRVGNLSFKRVEPDMEWSLAFSGPMKHTVGARTERREVSIDLKYRAINEVFDYRDCASGGHLDIATTSASEHTEQFGRLTGEISIDGKVRTVDALGERDHSWGVRDWVPPSSWIWLSGQFSEREAFNITKLWIGHTVLDGGFVHYDGRNRPIIKVLANTTYDDDGGPRHISLVLQEKSGRTHEMTAQAIRAKTLPFGTEAERRPSVLHTALIRLASADRVGYGFAEYLVRER